MIKAVIFDCFGVIYIDANQAAFNLLKIPNDSEKQRRYREIMDARCLGYIDKNESRRQMAEMVGVSVDVWSQALKQVNGRDPDMLTLIRQLKESGLKTALLSNAGKNQLNELFSKDEQKELFDICVVSGDISIIKPDPEIYFYTAQKLGLKPQDCLLVDDNKGYCQGAKAVGMQAIHYISFDDLLKNIKKFQLSL